MASLAAQNEVQAEIQELRECVQEYKPGTTVTVPDKIQFPENVFIGLFGRTGCGKSSLINSLKFTASGRLRRSLWLEIATQEKAGGHTMFRKIANLTSSIYVIDNRGLDDPNTEEALRELQAQLDGLRGYSEKVQWSGAPGSEDDSLDIDLRVGHPISCAVFVFSATHDITSSVNGLNEVVDFLHSHQGRYPVAVITHVDVAERKVVDVIATVLRVAGISDIYEVANITQDKTRLEDEYQLNLLTLIERCMTVGDETVVFKHYQRKELEKKMERKRLQQKASSEVRRQSAETEVTPKVSTSHQQEQPSDFVTASKEPDSLEEERREVDQMKLDLERRKMELEFQERELKMKMEFEEAKRQIENEQRQMESRERQLQGEERERRYQEAIRQAEEEKRHELMRIMEANRSSSSRNKGSGPLFGINLNVPSLPGCKMQ